MVIQISIHKNSYAKYGYLDLDLWYRLGDNATDAPSEEKTSQFTGQ